MTFKLIIITLSLCIGSIIYAQNGVEFGSRIKMANKSLFYKGVDDNFPYYYTNTDIIINKPSFEIVGRTISKKKFKDSSKFKISYTLEVGILFAKYTQKRTVVYEDPPWDSDTIGRYSRYNSKSRKIGITNYIDFAYKISDKYTFINSLGIKIESPGGKIKSYVEGSYILSDYDHTDRNKNKREVYPYFNNYDAQKPILPFIVKLQYSPQLKVHFDSFSLNINLVQDIFVLNKLSSKMYSGFFDSATYTGLGLFFIPNFNSKFDENLLKDNNFDY